MVAVIEALIVVVYHRVGAVYQIRVVLYDMEMGVEICIGLTLM